MRIRPRCDRLGLALLMAVSLLAACRTMSTQDLLTPGRISVHLTGQGENTKLLKVTPPVEALCKKNSTPDCMDQVTWRLLPNAGRLPDGWRVKISEKSNSPAKNCFATVWLDADNDGEAQSKEPAESCRAPWTVWAYDVTLVNGKSEPKSTIDPLLVMYNY